MEYQWELFTKNAKTGKSLCYLSKIHKTGFLVDFVMRHGENQVNFMEQVKTFYLLSKMIISLLYLLGPEQMINYNGEMTSQLDWEEVHMVDSDYI